MRDRPGQPPRRPTRRLAVAVDLVILSPREGELHILLMRGGESRAAGSRWALPWDALVAGETLAEAAQRIAEDAARIPATEVVQTGAVADARRHPGDADLSVSYVALVPAGAEVEPDPDAYQWMPLAAVPPLAPRHRDLVDASIAALRVHLDASPVAFHLLPPTFTLSELQAIYEILLGRALHKASFRRALQAADLVEPIDEWRSEGRGRPAQLFRYAPKKKRNAQRALRFDFLER